MSATITVTPETEEFVQQPKVIGPWTRAGLQVLSGGSAGFVEVLINQPLDVVKTRMQLQSNTIAIGQVQYKGVFNCFHLMYKQEGLLSFWKGMIPPILAETPKRATKFLCFEQTKQFFMFGAKEPTPITYSLAGLTAGLIEAVVVNPFEVVKVAQQADRRAMKEAASTRQVAAQIIKNGGFGSNGLFKGVTATLARNGAFNMVYFGFYHSIKNIFPAYKDQTAELFRKLLIGFSSGVLACVGNTPFDVVKSRIQGPQPQPGVVKYKSTFKSLAIVYKEEGFRALYKGFVPKVMRLGPGGAIMLIVFDHVYEYLQANWA